MCRAETEAREDDQSKKPLQAYGAVTILVSDMAKYYFKVHQCQRLRNFGSSWFLVKHWEKLSLLLASRPLILGVV